jgi:antitoxin YefM
MATIAPISEVKRRLASFIDDVRKKGESLYVTQHGRPVAVLMGYEEYEALIRRVEDLEDLQAIKQSLAAPEEEAMTLEEYERRRASQVHG